MKLIFLQIKFCYFTKTRNCVFLPLANGNCEQDTVGNYQPFSTHLKKRRKCFGKSF